MTFCSKLTFATHLREVVPKSAIIPGVMCRAGKLYNYSFVLKSYFNAYVLPNLEYCAPVWMASTESYLNLLDTVVRSGETSCEDELLLFGAQKEGQCLVFVL